MLITEIDDE